MDEREERASSTIYPQRQAFRQLMTKPRILLRRTYRRSGTIPGVGSLRSGLVPAQFRGARLHFSVRAMGPEYLFSPFTFRMTFIAPSDFRCPHSGRVVGPKWARSGRARQPSRGHDPRLQRRFVQRQILGVRHQRGCMRARIVEKLAWLGGTPDPTANEAGAP